MCVYFLPNTYIRNRREVDKKKTISKQHKIIQINLTRKKERVEILAT